MRHFGIGLKAGFESQHVKFFLPNFHHWICKEFGIFKAQIIWLGLNVHIDLWLETKDE